MLSKRTITRSQTPRYLRRKRKPRPSAPNEPSKSRAIGKSSSTSLKKLGASATLKRKRCARK